MDPSSELLDHVDADDRVIGTVARSRAHREGLWHRAVHVIVWNHRGEILLQKRAATKASFPGCWDTSVGGHVGAGEGYLATALRECAEELGIEIASTDLSRIGKHLFDEMDTDVEWVESWALLHEGPFAPDPVEVERVDWFSADAVEAMVADGALTPHFVLQWRRELAAMTRERAVL
jgi:isopentenyl-diphosphate Delta-isomerase